MSDPIAEKLLETTGNVMLRAGAGTGKTYNLTRRVIHLLTGERCRLDQILVLTFTDYAAAEMRERIYSELNKAIQSTTDPELRNHLIREKRDFPGNYISTFHSFCNRILQYYPDDVAAITVTDKPRDLHNLHEKTSESGRKFTALDAGPGSSLYGKIRETRLESGFEIQGGYEEILQQQEIRRDFYRIYKESPVLKNQLNNLRVPDLESFSVKLTDLGHEELVSLAGLSPDGYIDMLRSLQNRIGNEMDDLFIRIRELIEEYSEGFRDEYIAADDIETHLDLSNKAGDLKKRYMQKGDTDLIKAEIDPMSKSLKTLYNRSGHISAVISQPDLREKMEAYRESGEYNSDIELYWSIRELAELSLRWTSYQRFRRIESSRLNFDDIIWLTRTLLKHNDAIAGDLRKRFEFVLVDEFQDTDRHQWEIVKQLSRIFDAPNVLIVGDVKQAIYGFRGGDVTVMDLAARDMEKSGYEDLCLDYSFRSNPAVISFCNELFRHCFDELAAAPFTATPQNLLVPDNENARNRAEPGNVLILDYDRSVLDVEGVDPRLKDRVKDEKMWLEALRVASHLKKISLGSEPGFERITRKMQSGDKAVGILLRRRKYQYLYEMALRRYGLPYTVSSGRGFFNRQEITDIANLLRFLLDAFDDLSLAGVLRSPWVGLSDTGLLAVRNEMNANPADYPTFWSAVKDHETWGAETLIGPDRLVLNSSIGTLKDLREQAKLKRVSELIESAVNSTFFYAGFRNDKQVVQNVNKLLTVIREMELNGEGTLFEIVTFLKTQSESEADEKDAGLPETGSIQIMTIHNSKGLQFPMVVLPDTSGRAGRSGLNLYTTPTDERDKATPCFSYNVKDREMNSGSGQDEAILHADLKARTAKRDDAEMRRLFYVALTRAETHLLICNTAALPGSLNYSSGFAAYLKRWLDTMPETGLFEKNLLSANETLELLDGTDSFIGKGEAADVAELKLIPRDRLDAAATWGMMTAKSVTRTEVISDAGTAGQEAAGQPWKSRESHETIAANDTPETTDASDYHSSDYPGSENTSKANQPKETKSAGDIPPAGARKQWGYLSADLAGTLIHKGIELSLKSPENTRRLLINAGALHGVDLNSEKAGQELQNLIRHVENARNFLNSKFPTPAVVMHEIEFEAEIMDGDDHQPDGTSTDGKIITGKTSATITGKEDKPADMGADIENVEADIGLKNDVYSNGFFQRGVIDMLLQTADGTWHLIDFKSAHPSGDLNNHAITAGYADQLRVYCRAAETLTGGRVRVGPENAVLLFTAGDEAMPVTLEEL